MIRVTERGPTSGTKINGNDFGYLPYTCPRTTRAITLIVFAFLRTRRILHSRSQWPTFTDVLPTNRRIA